VDLIAVVNPVMASDVAAAAQGSAGLAARPRITKRQVDHLWSVAREAVGDVVPNRVAVTIHVLDGKAEELLTERSGELDLLVLGSRSSGPLGRVLLGSVSSAVARAAECPLVITPRSDQPGDAVSNGVDLEVASLP
jgi:nucleotide-binding universal stress UspA family protein